MFFSNLLDGDATLRVRPFGHTQPPVPPLPVDASAATIRQGHQLYAGHCLGCHGVNAVAGSLPDLRYLSAAVHAQFESIVLGGSLEAQGMPGFGDLLNAEQVKAIQQYVLSQGICWRTTCT